MARRKYTEEEARERKNARQREYAKRTGYAASQKYDKEKTTTVIIRIMENTEGDILKHLNAVSNKSGYVKNLIRKDMKIKQFKKK